MAATTPTTKPATTDTAVAWFELSSKQGALRGKLPELLKAEIAKAKASGRTPFIEVGATWCAPCLALEASLHNKDMIDAFAGTYIIHLDTSEWDVDDDMGSLGFKSGPIPIIASLSPAGKITNQYDGDMTASAIKQYLHAHLWKIHSQKTVAAAN